MGPPTPIGAGEVRERVRSTEEWMEIETEPPARDERLVVTARLSRGAGA